MLELTKNKAAFCEEYVLNGFKKTDAYLKAFETDNKSTANTESARLLRDQRVQDRISEIEGNYKTVGHNLGIDKKRVIQKIIDLMDATKPIIHQGNIIGQQEDTSSQNTAITTYLKLVGDFSPEKREVTVTEDTPDISKLSEEERKQLKDKLIKGL